MGRELVQSEVVDTLPAVFYGKRPGIEFIQLSWSTGLGLYWYKLIQTHESHGSLDPKR
jgi:hypothetical protein